MVDIPVFETAETYGEGPFGPSRSTLRCGKHGDLSLNSLVLLAQAPLSAYQTRWESPISTVCVWCMAQAVTCWADLQARVAPETVGWYRHSNTAPIAMPHISYSSRIALPSIMRLMLLATRNLGDIAWRRRVWTNGEEAHGHAFLAPVTIHVYAPLFESYLRGSDKRVEQRANLI